MNIKIQAKNFSVTPAIEEYAYKKVSLLSKFLGTSEQETICEVELGKTTNHHKSGDIFKAEINLRVPGRKQYYAVAEESDLYIAIDKVHKEIEREIVSTKGKRVKMFKRGAGLLKSLLKRINIGREQS